MKKHGAWVYLLGAVVLTLGLTLANAEKPAQEAKEGKQETPAKPKAPEWLTDYEAIKKLAAEKKLPILIDFSGSDWCGWCMKLDKEVFSQPEFQTWAQENVVLFLCDFPSAKPQTSAVKKQNASLQEKYKIEGYPTILLVNAEGKELARTGYKAGGAAKYVEHLKSLLGKK